MFILCLRTNMCCEIEVAGAKNLFSVIQGAHKQCLNLEKKQQPQTSENHLEKLETVTSWELEGKSLNLLLPSQNGNAESKVYEETKYFTTGLYL